MAPLASWLVRRRFRRRFSTSLRCVPTAVASAWVERSASRTGTPERARAEAIPAPMTPAPTTVAWAGRAGSEPSARLQSFLAASDPKKMPTRLLQTVPVASSATARASRPAQVRCGAEGAPSTKSRAA